MDLNLLLSTPERQRLLFYFLDNPEKEININGVSRELGLSVGLVHKYVKILQETSFIENKLLLDDHRMRSLRVVRNTIRLDESGLVSIIRKKVPKTKGIGIYGSWAKGNNTKGSDVDVWIKCHEEIDDLALARLVKGLSDRLGIPVDILVVTPERMEHVQKNAESLYHSIYHSILLWGEEP